MSNIIVVGCGRVGSRLALMLSNYENNVCVIDRDPRAFASLGRDFNGATFAGVGYDEDVLMKAGIDECDFLAAVTQSDNVNLMVVEIARRLYNVPHAFTTRVTNAPIYNSASTMFAERRSLPKRYSRRSLQAWATTSPRWAIARSCSLRSISLKHAPTISR